MTKGDRIIYRLRELIGDHTSLLTYRAGLPRPDRWQVSGAVLKISGDICETVPVRYRCEWTATEMLAFPVWRLGPVNTGFIVGVFPVADGTAIASPDGDTPNRYIQGLT